MKKIFTFLFVFSCLALLENTVFAATDRRYVGFTRSGNTITLFIDSDTAFGENVVAEATYPTSQYTGIQNGTYLSAGANYGNGLTYYRFTVTLTISSAIDNSNIAIQIGNRNQSGTVYALSGFTIPLGTSQLPVSLTVFSTRIDNLSVSISWQTVSETNNAFFEIERSADVKVWETLARIDGKGTTNQQQNYTYLDQTPRKGINYYRLKQVDTDGTFAYSRVRDAVIERNPDANVYPNPVSDLLRISGISEATEVNIMDLLGNTKFQKTIQRDSDIDLKGFSEGVYLVRITDETATKVRKIRVIR